MTDSKLSCGCPAGTHINARNYCEAGADRDGGPLCSLGWPKSMRDATPSDAKRIENRAALQSAIAIIALDAFPTMPVIGDRFVSKGVIWIYDGLRWCEAPKRITVDLDESMALAVAHVLRALVHREDGYNIRHNPHLLAACDHMSNVLFVSSTRVASVHDFGAKGDGVTDDRVAVHDAINLAVAIPAGDYNIGKRAVAELVRCQSCGINFGEGATAKDRERYARKVCGACAGRGGL